MQICKYTRNGKCANPDCPMREYACPVTGIPGVCKYEEFAPQPTKYAEYTETVSLEFTRIHKLSSDADHHAKYEATLRADPTEWIKALLGADDIKVVSHKVFVKG